MGHVDGFGSPDAQGFAGDAAFGDRPGIEGAHLALQRDGRAGEVELGFGLVQLVRVGDAFLRLCACGERFAGEHALQTFGQYFGGELRQAVVEAAAGVMPR
jgi:hypothetical protein